VYSIRQTKIGTGVGGVLSRAGPGRWAVSLCSGHLSVGPQKVYLNIMDQCWQLIAVDHHYVFLSSWIRRSVQQAWVHSNAAVGYGHAQCINLCVSFLKHCSWILNYSRIHVLYIQIHRWGRWESQSEREASVELISIYVVDGGLSRHHMCGGGISEE